MEIIQYVVFWAWLLWLNMVLLRFILAVYQLFLLIPEEYCLVYPFTDIHRHLFPGFGHYGKSCYEHLSTLSLWTCYYFSWVNVVGLYGKYVYYLKKCAELSLKAVQLCIFTSRVWELLPLLANTSTLDVFSLWF